MGISKSCAWQRRRPYRGGGPPASSEGGGATRATDATVAGGVAACSVGANSAVERSAASFCVGSEVSPVGDETGLGDCECSTRTGQRKSHCMLCSQTYPREHSGSCPVSCLHRHVPRSRLQMLRHGLGARVRLRARYRLRMQVAEDLLVL